MLENTKNTDSHIKRQFVTHRKVRSLLGWLNHDEAIRLLLGHDPAPGEDLVHVEKLYAQQRKAVASRMQPSISTSIVESVTTDWNLEVRAQDATLRSALAGLDWSLQIVDLRRVIAYQKMVTIDGLDERIAPAQADSTQLLELCLPREQAEPPKNLLRDADQKGFTISSLNPNLRIAGNQVKTVQVAPEEGMQPTSMLAVTFLISMGTSYLKVASYKDRDFLREGYHRAAALLRAGIYEIPCVYIKARSLEDLGGNRETTLHYDILFGDRPPLLDDFWNDNVSAVVDQQVFRKAIRVTAEEFEIQG